MDISIGDSKIISHIMKDSLSKVFGEMEGSRLYEVFSFGDFKTSRLIHNVSETMMKTQHSDRLKDLLERIGEELSSRVDVRPSLDELSIGKEKTEEVTINVANRFDLPLLFDVTLEDRDGFLPIVYNKIDGAYFNGFSMESIIDTGASNDFKFKVCSEKSEETGKTTLLIVVRSKDVEGLNWIGKLRVNFS